MTFSLTPTVGTASTAPASAGHANVSATVTSRFTCNTERHYYCPDCDQYHWYKPTRQGGRTLMNVFAEMENQMSIEEILDD